ncbi:MAG: hypothetical protein ACI9V9_000474 [Oleispira sp.]|jgi:hypothetical protein
MELFKGHNLLEFACQFKIDKNSKESLLQIMRQEDYRAVNVQTRLIKFKNIFLNL